MVGRSNIVGRPLSSLLEKKDATVTLCHSKTSEQDLINELRSADIIISAVGIPRFIKQSMISFKQTLIDVGINRDEDGKLIGDMDFEDVSQFCNYITPVPGGVGPMTVAMLMQNTVLAGEICYEKKIKKMAHKNV